MNYLLLFSKQLQTEKAQQRSVIQIVFIHHHIFLRCDSHFPPQGKTREGFFKQSAKEVNPFKPETRT